MQENEHGIFIHYITNCDIYKPNISIHVPRRRNKQVHVCHVYASL